MKRQTHEKTSSEKKTLEKTNSRKTNLWKDKFVKKQNHEKKISVRIFNPVSANS